MDVNDVYLFMLTILIVIISTFQILYTTGIGTQQFIPINAKTQLST
jgi:hypothetical protein